MKKNQQYINIWVKKYGFFCTHMKEFPDENPKNWSDCLQRGPEETFSEGRLLLSTLIVPFEFLAMSMYYLVKILTESYWEDMNSDSHFVTLSKLLHLCVLTSKKFASTCTRGVVRNQ